MKKQYRMKTCLQLQNDGCYEIHFLVHSIFDTRQFAWLIRRASISHSLGLQTFAYRFSYFPHRIMCRVPNHELSAFAVLSLDPIDHASFLRTARRASSVALRGNL
jgi:hypothetical protein